jgi:hypothetical protein
MAVEQINNLTDNDNFGEWLVKIKEIISKLNTNLRIADENKANIDLAFSSGQLGDALSVSSYNDCLHSGLYHINNTSNPANVYVASNGNCVTQIAVTEGNPPSISIRNGMYTRKDNGDIEDISFSEWRKLTDKDYTDSTFLPFTGGNITGSLSVSGNTSTNTLTSGDVNLTGSITHSNGVGVLSVTNDGEKIIFDGNKNNSPHILFYVNKDTKTVSTDYDGKDVKYYLHTDGNGTESLVHYNIEYFIHNHLDTLNDYKNGKVAYYIQNDGRVTIVKNDTVTQFYKEGNAFLDATAVEYKLKYFAKDNDVHEYTTQFYISNNEVFRETSLESKVYDIEDNEVVYYSSPFFIEENVVKSSDTKEIVYYIHTKEDSTSYLSSLEDGSVEDYFLTEIGVYSDKELTNLVYSRKNESLLKRNIMYYIHSVTDIHGNTYTMWSVDEKGETPSLYIFKDEVILLNTNPKYVIKKYKGTLSADKEGLDTRFYIQSDGRITSDIIGTQVKYLFDENKTYVAKDHTPNVIAFYVWNDKLITHTTMYHIQSNGNVTSDIEGLDVCYEYDNENGHILNINYPISIDLLKNVCNINGTAEQANELSQRGMTHSFTSGDTNLAASGKAVMDLNESIKGKYIPFTGGIFTGLVSHTEDILLGKMAKIRAYEKLNFHSLGEISFVVNSDSGQIYIDRQNDLDTTSSQPCVFGARIREGVTESESGDPIYALGSIEFTEDATRIRFRKTNITNVEDPKDENTDISLYLTSTYLYPSKDRAVTLGKPNARYNNIYLYKSNITSSDEELSTSITNIDDTLLNKWKDINWKSYKFKSSVEEKGENARLHTGLIAQEVKEALSDIEVTKYAFFCEDNGGLSLRYQEAQAIENAYLRKELNNLKEEIEALKNLIQ